MKIHLQISIVIKKSDKLDNLVKRSAYINEWKERKGSPMGEIQIVLEFSKKLEPTDQVYSNIANEIYLSDISLNIVEQTDNTVLVQLSNSDLIFKQFKRNTK